MTLTATEQCALTFKISVFYLIPYLVDYILDITNGYNFIHGISLVLFEICDTSYTRNYTYGVQLRSGSGSCFGPEIVEANRIAWATFSLCLVFLPGIAFAFVKAFQFIQQNDPTNESSRKTTVSGLAIECIGSILFYPFFVAFKHMKSCFKIMSGEDEDQWELDLLLNFGIMEVVLEAAPQLILQLHTIITGFCPTLLQILSMLSSLLFIVKTGVEFHMGSEVFRMPFMDRIAKTFKLLFLFLTCIIFRLGTLTILVTHINWWVIVPCLISSCWVAVLARSCGLCFLPAISAGPINLFIMGSGVNLEGNKCEAERRGGDLLSFYKKSTSFMFIWNTLVLGGFLVAWTFVADCHTDEDFIKRNMFYQAEWRQKVFMRENIIDYGLYAVSGGIIFTGALNLIFLFINAGEELAPKHEIEAPKEENEKLKRGLDTVENSFEE